MRMPTFNAEASLGKAGDTYRISAAQHLAGSGTLLLPQANACKDAYDDCVSKCGDDTCKSDCWAAYSLCLTPISITGGRRLQVLRA